MGKEFLYKEVEIRSDEVQEVMNKIPSAVLRYGIIVLFFVLLILFIGSILFSYPNKVNVEFTLMTNMPPSYLKSINGGRIEHIYVANGQHVYKGDYLAVLENSAKTEQILFLENQLLEWLNRGGRLEDVGKLFQHYLPFLGDVQSAFSNCVKVWNSYLLHMNESRTYEVEVLNALAELNTAIAEWKRNFLFVSPSNGEVAFMQLWKDNQLVSSGETMFVVVPSSDSYPIGKALLPMSGAAKVKLHQRVIIHLDGFSEQEYGFLEGMVESISPVPDETGNYIVAVSFPKGLITTYGRKLPAMKVMSGSADIVTEEKNLFERLIRF